jgi:hypothetical protein
MGGFYLIPVGTQALFLLGLLHFYRARMQLTFQLGLLALGEWAALAQ